jgi:hypothetical protein
MQVRQKKETVNIKYLKNRGMTFLIVVWLMQAFAEAIFNRIKRRIK